MLSFVNYFKVLLLNYCLKVLKDNDGPRISNISQQFNNMGSQRMTSFLMKYFGF